MGSSTRGLYVGLCLVALPLLATPLAAQTGAIGGTVTDEALAPIGGLSVQLEDEDGGFVDAMSTGAGTGVYLFTGLADGEYLVRALPSGFDVVGEYYDGASVHDRDLATRLTISGGSTLSGIDFVLAPAGSISGTVSGPGPGDSAHLSLNDALTGRGRGGVESDSTTGDYTFDGLAAGSYLLHANAFGTDRASEWYSGKRLQSEADPVAVGADEDVAAIDFALSAGTSISGTVTLVPDPGDGTVTQMWIQINDAVTGEGVGGAQPQANGAYLVENLPAGTYAAIAHTHQTGYVQEAWVSGGGQAYHWNEGDPISVDAGSPAAGIDFELEPGHTISGHVFLESVAVNGIQDDGEPDVSWASVQAHPVDVQFWGGTGTDGAGDYAMSGLPPGRYNVTVESASYEQPFVGYWQNPVLADVTSGDATGVDFAVTQERVVSGKVFLDSDDDQVQDEGEPPLGALVRAYDLATGSHVAHAAQGHAGTYSVGLASGTYRIEADPPSGLLRESWENVFFADQATPVDVTAGDAGDIDFGLVPGSVYGTLRGRVVAADDPLTGIAGVRVDVNRFGNYEGLRSASTDAGGYFVVTGLPPASLRVWFDTESTNAAHGTDYVGGPWADVGGSQRIDYPAVAGDGTDLGTFELSTGGSISGVVYPPPGVSLPLPFSVQAESSQPGGPHIRADVEADGSYHVRGLAPGLYRVATEQHDPGLTNAYYVSASESTFDWSFATEIEVTAGLETPGIDLFLLEGGSITGRITRAADGQPVAGFPIFANLINDPQGRGYWPGHTSTDANGDYLFSGLPSGGYEVQTDGRDTDLANEEYPTPVVVTAPLETPNIDFALEAGARIRGRVTRSVDGTPLVGLRVEAFEPYGQWWSDTHTDASGDYSIGGLPQDTSYLVRVRTQDSSDPQVRDLIGEYYPDSPFRNGAQPVAVGTGGGVVEVTGIDFALELGGSIGGTVTEEAGGQAVPGAHIGLMDPVTNEQLDHRNTANDGTYLIAGLPEGGYLVYVDPHGLDLAMEYWDDAPDYSGATPIAVAATPPAGPVPRVENIDFALPPALTIGGTVTRSDGVTPIAGLNVQAQGPCGQSDRTASDGTYEIGRLCAGTFDVYVETSGTGWAFTLQQVDLTAGSVTGVDFALGPGASISGTVVDAEFQQPLADVGIQVFDFDNGRWIADGLTDDLGVYEASGLSAGSYWVETRPDERNYARTYWQNDVDQPDPVVVAESGGVPQDVTGIDFVLVEGFEIRGQVFWDVNQNGVRDTGEPGVSCGLNAHMAGGGGGHWIGTDSDGGYVFHGLYPGSYIVQAQGAGSLMAEYYQDAYVWSQATPVDVSAGHATGIDFSLVDGSVFGSLRGTVTGSGPLQGVRVDVQDFDSGEGFGSVYTDALGQFEFANLPPGSYRAYLDTHEYNAAHGADYIGAFWSLPGEPGVIDPNLQRIDHPENPGGAGTELDPFALTSGGSISGTVVPPPGYPLPASLQVGTQSVESGHWVVTGEVDANGDYHLRGLPAPATYWVGTADWSTGDLVVVYYLNATESTFHRDGSTAVEVELGQESPGIDLFPWVGGSISGNVTRASDGAPVVNAHVQSHLVNDPLGRNYWQGGANTDLDGAYVIRGLPAGEYQVHVNSNDPQLANQTYPSFVAVVLEQERPGVDFALEAAGSISGCVTYFVDPDWAPVVNMRIDAAVWATDEWAGDAYTGADGCYVLGSLLRGESYTVGISPWDHPDPQFSNFIAQSVQDVQVPVEEPGEVHGVDFQLELGGAISGLVREETTGDPLQNIGVCAWDFGGGGHGNCDSTEHNGFYIIRGLPEGSYAVDANPWPRDWVREYWEDTTDHNLATPVAVAAVPEGGPIPITENIDFDLAPAFRISGRVFADADENGVYDSGEELPGLRVNANGIDVAGGSGQDTRQDGTYELSGLPAGQYELSVDSQGTNWIRQSREVDLTAGSLTGEDFLLLPGAIISGRVYVDLDESGDFTPGDVPGAGVNLGIEGFYDEEWIGDVDAGQDGFYQLGGLETGSYRVYLNSNELNLLPMYFDNVFDWQQASPVEIFEVGGTPQDVTGVDFRATQGYEIRGEIFYDANGDGVRQVADEPRLGLQVLAWEEWHHHWGWTEEEDSTYVIHSLAPGDYQVMAHADGTPYASEFYGGASFKEDADVVQIVDADLTGIDIGVDLGGGVTGTVYDRATGEPLANISMGANPHELSGPWSGTRTDSQGRYLLRGLPEGEYVVDAWDDDGDYVYQVWDDALFWDDATPISVVARSAVDDPLASTADFHLDRAGAIEGTVTDTAGDPVAGAYIEVLQFDDPWDYFGEAQTEADGTYRVDGLPPGLDLRLEVGPPAPYYPVFYDGGTGSPYEEDAVRLTVTSGGTTSGIDVTVEEGGSVAGRVYDRATGAGVANVDIGVDFFHGHGVAWGSTDANGDFEIGGLVPGRDVQVHAHPSSGDYVPVIWDGGDGDPDWGNAAPVSIAAGQVSGGIDLALDRGGYIAGVVRDGDGNPLRDQGVWVNHYDDGWGAGGAETGGDGSYLLGPMLPGDFRVEAAYDPYRHEYYDDQQDWSLADRVPVQASQTTSGIDFVLAISPEVLTGPTPAAGERGTTVTGVTLEVQSLVGDPPHYCAVTPDPPCVRVAFGGSGLTVQNPALDPQAGILTFDLAISATATLGLVNVSVINDQALEDGVAAAPGFFEVQPAAGGVVPAPSAERLYVNQISHGRVRAYGVADNAYLGDVETCGFPYSLAASGDGSHLFVGCSGVVSVIDTRLGEVGEEVARIELTGWGDDRVAVGSDFLYAYDQQFTNRVRVVDRLTWEVRDDLEIPLSAWPYGIYLEPSGRYLWVNLRDVQEIGLVDLQPASGTYEVLAPIPLPARFNQLAFAPGGARAWVATQGGLFEIDTALAVSDPASSLTQVLDLSSGSLAVAQEEGSGRLLAFLLANEQVAVYDVSGPGGAAQLATFRATDGWSSIYSLAATSGKLYLYNGDLYHLYGVELGELDGSTLSTVRFDSRSAGRGLYDLNDMAIAATPTGPPAGAPTLTLDSGSPAVNGSPFDVYVSGTGLTAETRVLLRDALTRPAVELQGDGSLKLTFPAMTPTGEYTLVATNPVPGGPESGASDVPLVIQPPADYAPGQTVYFNRYTRGSVGAFRPGLSVDYVAVQPYPYAMSVTPDGKTGFAVHYDYGEWPGNVKPERLYDTTIIDLDTEPMAWVATVPWTLHASAPPAVTPSVDDPDGVYAYVANRIIGDTVAVIDPATRAEVDIDNDPATESFPAQHPWFWWWPPEWELPHPLAGINRVHLDADPLNRNLQPNDVALTPDGNLLYTANRSGSVSVVNAVSYQPLGETLHNLLTYANHVVITPKQVGGKIWVWVTGYDNDGRAALFVAEAGVLDEAAWTKIVLPLQDEFPREVSISADGKTLWATIRVAGVLLAMKTEPAKWGRYDSICVTPQGTVVKQDTQGLCSDAGDAIPGMLQPSEAAADGLLYLNNSYRSSETWVLDLTDNYRLVTTLGLSEATYLAIEPVVASEWPVVNAVSPSSGSDLGGDPVVIAGANFEAGASVRFGSQDATGVVVDNAYTIRAVTPAHAAGVATVWVTNPDGKKGSLDNAFTFETDTTPPVFTTPPWEASQVLAGPTGAETVTVEIRWATDEAATSDLEYRRVGDPDFLQASDPALVTDHLVTLTGLEPSTDYEYRAASTDNSGNAAESPVAPATRVFTTIALPDTTPPVIVSGPTAAPAEDSAVVSWETNEPATSVVRYDDQLNGVYELVTAGASGVTTHTVTLTGLDPETEYEYAVYSTDASGNGPAESTGHGFTTGGDGTPPVILSGPEVGYLGNDLVIVLWQTDELSTSFVNYGVSSVDENGVIDVDLVTDHVVFLTNLLPGVTYYFQAGSTDPSGNTVMSDDPLESLPMAQAGTVTLGQSLRAGVVQLAAGTRLEVGAALGSFTTPSAPDVTPPTVLATRITALSHDRALVEVDTDEAASLLARYGVAGLAHSAFAPAFSRASSVLLAGLEGGTTYQVELVLTDPKGNATTVSGIELTTPEAPDTTAPTLAGLAVTAVTPETATVVWTTDEPADASVRLGVSGGALDRQRGVLGLATTHSVRLGGLAPGTDYAFEALSRDSSGNVGIASGAFTTPAAVPEITSVVPPSAAQGASLEVAINGLQLAADSVADFGAGVTVAGLTVNVAGTQLRAAIEVAVDAPVGARQIVVTSGGHQVAAPFSIVDDTPPVVEITAPADGAELQSATVVVHGTVSEPATVTVNGVAATVQENPAITFEAEITLAGPGLHSIVARAVDLSGNLGTDVHVVELVNQPPVALCQDVVVLAGPGCTAAASVDAGTHDPDGDEFTLEASPAGPYGLGETTVTLTATDSKGASSTCEAKVHVQFEFDGFLPPIDGADQTGGGFGDPLRSFKLESTIPIKFGIACGGVPYLEGVHTLQAIHWTSETDAEEPIDATPQDAATLGNEFRLTGEEWHHNLDAQGSGMGQGQWQLLATLADGSQHSVWIQVK